MKKGFIILSILVSAFLLKEALFLEEYETSVQAVQVVESVPQKVEELDAEPLPLEENQAPLPPSQDPIPQPEPAVVNPPINSAPANGTTTVNPMPMDGSRIQQMRDRLKNPLKPEPAVVAPAAPASEPVNQNPAQTPEVSAARQELLSQVKQDSLVTCQTKIVNCEPKQQNQEFANPDQTTFCVTYAVNCDNEESIGRIFKEEEVFPQNQPIHEEPAQQEPLPEESY